jgi:putative N6-adenine-specific DNA methylase
LVVTKTEKLEFYASAIPGTEQALCDELRELGFKSVRLNRGGIPFRGTWEDGWRACLESRIAQRIQVVVTRFQVPTQKALYDGVAAINWLKYISPDHTISVSSFCVASTMKHSGFVALKTKDAIVDDIRRRDPQRRRPSVDKDDPDVRIFVYLTNNKATVYLDLSGDALHRRGYRQQAGEAPLRETLAAALVRMSGWDRQTPFLDPMCGSGTIAIEAAMWAANRAPGLTRERFGFERWNNYTEEMAEEMRALRGDLRGRIRGQLPKIQAADIDGDVLEIAKVNARAAGVRMSFKQRDIRDMQASTNRTLVVTNPPYDVRLGADERVRHSISSAVSRMHGWRACLLAGHEDYEYFISKRPEEVVELKNGAINCAFLIYEID